MSTLGWIAVSLSVLSMVACVVSTALTIKWSREADEARARYRQAMDEYHRIALRRRERQTP